MYVTGNLPELGNWDPTTALRLNPDINNPHLWSVNVQLLCPPTKKPIEKDTIPVFKFEYKYFEDNWENVLSSVQVLWERSRFFSPTLNRIARAISGVDVVVEDVWAIPLILFRDSHKRSNGVNVQLQLTCKNLDFHRKMFDSYGSALYSVVTCILRARPCLVYEASKYSKSVNGDSGRYSMPDEDGRLVSNTSMFDKAKVSHDTYYLTKNIISWARDNKLVHILSGIGDTNGSEELKRIHSIHLSRNRLAHAEAANEPSARYSEYILFVAKEMVDSLAFWKLVFNDGGMIPATLDYSIKIDEKRRIIADQASCVLRANLAKYAANNPKYRENAVTEAPKLLRMILSILDENPEDGLLASMVIDSLGSRCIPYWFVKHWKLMYD